jgi:hypothetical protein
MPYFYAFSIFLSAFLLFQIQPMIGKYILPWFGGTTTVWSTVLLFFQTLLIGGYAYAYWLLGQFQDRRQGLMHLIFLGGSLTLLLITALIWPSPLMPDTNWWLGSRDLPIWGILRILAISVGIPFLVLASNSTLMQAWFNRDYHTSTPYRLYALSNAGSLLALISYPILFEPFLTLRTQAYLWTAGYVVFTISVAYLSLRSYQRMPTEDDPSRADIQHEEDERPSNRTRALWVGLAACASVLLIAVTSQITQEVAVIPFLWILPLVIYLLTFILAFSGGRLYSRRVYLIAFFISLVTSRMLLNIPTSNIILQVIVYLLVLFLGCMLCHNELYNLRPHTWFLPSFYLLIAVGGAAGGVFVNLVAPYLFSTGFWELQWGLIASLVLVTIILLLEHKPVKAKRSRRSRQREEAHTRKYSPLVIFSSVFILLASSYVIYYMRSIATETKLARRNFYGVLRVWEINSEVPELAAYQLTHGNTVHGFQFQPDEIRHLPTTYYWDNSGVGVAIANHPARPGALRVGALGLGIGIIASYGEQGDLFRFYEINPDVIQVAEGEGDYFSFLSDSPADIQVIPGDGRVSLERELITDGPQGFDLLVLDAFSGDTIPLHLLTREAFEIYLKHLNENGVIAINVSNRYFNLGYEAYKLADEFNLGVAMIEDKGDGLQSYDSVWMLLTRDQAFLNLPAIAARSAPRPFIPPSLPLWTDDFSNLIQIIK